MKDLILQSTLYSGLLYFTYVALFRKLSFLKLNRAVLLAIPLMSIAIPIVAPLFETPAFATPLAIKLPAVTLGGEAAEVVNAAPSFSWWQWAYLGGLALSLMLLMAGLLKVATLVAKAEKWQENILLSSQAEGPFAFFKKVVIPKEMKDEQELPSIIRHEKAHVQHGHAFDNSFYALLCSLLWFNPFLHLLFRELKQVHECQADQAALSGTSHENYSKLLLAKIFGREISTLTASPFFNSSLIKTRISMIYKSKTKNRMKGLYLALLPLLAVMVLLSCSKQEAASKNDAETKAREVKNFAEAEKPPLFDNCDANASLQEQHTCFQKGVVTQVQKNFNYPEKLKETGVQGTMYVQFVIGKDGEIRNAEVVRSLPAETEAQKEALAEAEAEALRVVNAMPKLSSPIIDGKKAAVKFTLPFNLKLS